VESLRPFPDGQHRKEVSEEVGTGVQTEFVKLRRRTPRVVSCAFHFSFFA
jgi:hypothetical protein